MLRRSELVAVAGEEARTSASWACRGGWARASAIARSAGADRLFLFAYVGAAVVLAAARCQPASRCTSPSASGPSGLPWVDATPDLELGATSISLDVAPVAATFVFAGTVR